jgi:5-methylcytosine-specific restriction endonuclease McrA
MRQKAESESTLPYSFKYKIAKAFWGKKCPVCGVLMNNICDEEFGIVGRDFQPTIQHNKPISKGGKHELGNISVICKRCNVSLRDTETGELNAEEVKKVWLMLNG